MPLIAVNETRLFYTLNGNVGPPLVLVHGSWGDHSDWDFVIPPFARHYQVLAYDRRGHSQSQPIPEVDTIDADVADLAAMIEALDLAPAHLVGHSAGGCIALRLAAERPDLCRSSAVHEPPLVGLLADEPEHAQVMHEVGDRIAAVVERIERGDAEGGARLFVETLALGPGAWEMVPPEVRRQLVSNAQTFSSDVRDPNQLTVDLETLADGGCPVLVTSGDQSPAWFAQIVARLAAALPHADTHQFAGAGHLPMMTHVDEYVATVTAFACASAPTPAFRA